MTSERPLVRHSGMRLAVRRGRVIWRKFHHTEARLALSFRGARQREPGIHNPPPPMFERGRRHIAAQLTSVVMDSDQMQGARFVPGSMLRIAPE
jgi:hypothetical protein